MSVYEKMEAAIRAGDIEAYIALMANDCTFVRHQSGTTLNRDEIAGMLRKMNADGMVFGPRRLIYENDDILVTQSLNAYSDGTREAVLAAHMLREGQIMRIETGATPLAG